MKLRIIWVAMVAICSCVGCLNTHKDSNTKRLAVLPTPTAKADPVARAKTSEKTKESAELPAELAAKACLKTAEKLEESGFDQEAIAHYERARELAPKGTDVSRRLAILYDRCGLDDQAVAEFEKALSRSPNDADLLNDFGYYYCSRGNFATAERFLQRAVQANAAHAHAWANLATVYANTNRLDDAVKAYEHVVAPAAARCNVGILLAGHGETAKAKVYFRDAIKLDTNFEKAKSLLARLDQPSQGKTVTTESLVPAEDRK